VRGQLTAGIVNKALTCASSHRLQVPVVIHHERLSKVALKILRFRKPPQAIEVDHAALFDQLHRVLN